MTTLAAPVLFIDVIRPRQFRSRIAYDMFVVVAASILMAICAQIAIPFQPVPITGQTFGVLIIGALLGPTRGAAAMSLYLAEGAAGMPVFANFSFGVHHLFGPTGGYLFAFVPAAMLVGWLAQRGWDRRFISTVVAMTAGTAFILLCGFLWLSVLIGAEAALTSGVLPFLPGAVVKIVAAAALLPSGWKLLALLQRRL